MAKWILIAIFGTVAVTAGLVAILQRVNARSLRQRRESGGDAGPILVDGAHHRDPDTSDSGSGADAGGDGGGGGD